MGSALAPAQPADHMVWRDGVMCAVLYLMDARPYKAAVGNTVMGKVGDRHALSGAMA
jgi:hypothetical protein